jgi:Lar family restriction alleviation protein
MSTDEQVELTGCPFCGDRPRVQQNGRIPFGYWEVVCDTCDFAHAGHDLRAEAIAAWNRRAALTAALAQPGEDWRTIDSAPRDGTRVLGCHPNWTAPMTVQWSGDSWRLACPPTHWMPLPPPPSEEKQ